MRNYIRYYEKKPKRRFHLNFVPPSMTIKQKIAFSIFIIAIMVNLYQAQLQFISGAVAGTKTFTDVFTIFQNAQNGTGAGQVAFENIAQNYSWLEPFRYALNYINEAQLSSISKIASTSLSANGIFSHIESGLTIFACVAIAYKIVNHYIKTERHDNVSSVLSYFSYLGVFFLFLYSGTITSRLASLNQPVNTANINSIGTKINQELQKTIDNDAKQLALKLKAIDEEYATKTENTNVLESAVLSVEKYAKKFNETVFGFYVSNNIKYGYMVIFGLLITCALAVPAFIMSFVVKITLTIMLAGAKLVFLLAFIPGFENAWKTYLLNMLNVLLWIPIFNVIVTFTISIVSMTISDTSLGTGQIIWLTIVALVMSFQTISLTTSVAQNIINGAGAGVTGAMGGLASMGAIGIVSNTIQTGVQAGSMIATSGMSASMTASKIASKLEK